MAISNSTKTLQDSVIRLERNIRSLNSVAKKGRFAEFRMSRTAGDLTKLDAKLSPLEKALAGEQPEIAKEIGAARVQVLAAIELLGGGASSKKGAQSLAAGAAKELQPAHDALLAAYRAQPDSTSRHSKLAGKVLQLSDDPFAPPKVAATAAETTGYRPPAIPQVLLEFGSDLTAQARKSGAGPIIGRDDEIDQVINTLARKKKNNAVLIGEPGVGKTAIAEGLAQRIVAGDVPEHLKDVAVVEINTNRVTAGTMYRGMFEARMDKILKAVEASNGRIIPFIDEMHTIMDAGSAKNLENVGANILKPALARGKLRMIGATTLDEFQRIEQDGAMARRFRDVLVNEPDIETADQMMTSIVRGLEKNYDVKIPTETRRAAVELSDRYITDRFLPDKAVDLLEEAATGAMDEVQEGTQLVLTPDHISDVVERWTGIPVSMGRVDDADRFLHAESVLHERVIGQDEPVQAVADALRRSMAGFKPENKPIGSFIFAGPTGVGKTELAKSVADLMFQDASKIVRIDGSEYGDMLSARRLIGADAGSGGADGVLTEQVRRQPYSVVLFDEMEKAHPDVHDSFLQVLDDGILTDGKGRTVDFSNTVIIMTSNLGAEAFNRGVLDDAARAHVQNAFQGKYRPEYLNRFDEQVVFGPLDQSELREIVDIKAGNIIKQLKHEKDISLELSAPARDYIAQMGYDPKYGARPLDRALQNQLADPLSPLILDDTIEAGDTVLMDIDGSKVVYSVNGEKVLELPKGTAPDPAAAFAGISDAQKGGRIKNFIGRNVREALMAGVDG